MAAKKAEPAAAQPTEESAQRKPWKKKSPVEVVLDQIDKIREDVAKKEEDLKQARRQLQKGLRKLAGYLPSCEGIDTARLYRDGLAALERIEAGDRLEEYPRMHVTG